MFRFSYRNKYSNKKTIAHGRVYDSNKEAKRASELLLMEKAGIISNLKFQPVYVLLEAFTDNMGNKHRAIKYIADFSYIEKGKKIVEDSKGFKTDVYKLKKKLFLFKYPDIIFKES